MGTSDNEGGDTTSAAFPAINRKSMANDGEMSKHGSNTAPSREASRALTVDDNMASGRATSKSSLSRLASPNPSASDHATTLVGDESVPQSEPPTRRASTSSQMSSNKPVYGTRSKRRSGAPRVNYAEDVEMDFEMQNQQPPKQEKKSQYREDSLSELDDMEDLEPLPRLSVAPTKRVVSTAITVSTNGWNSSHMNEDPVPVAAIPVASSSSAPRKRKAAAVASQNIGASSHSASTVVTNGKKAGPIQTFQGPVRETNMVTFEKCNTRLNKDGNLVSDDGTVFAPNDHVYLICEPPGDPYYLGRIMEFRCKTPDDPTTQVEYVRINWAYRPRDVQRFVNDTRMVYVTMHSDLCPLTSLRGKCQLKHRSEIKDLDEFRKIPNAFWFNQCFDRFIHRWYEVIPASQVINVPRNVKKALDERWKYIVLESSRVKELTSAVKSCTRCSGYCAADDSVDCALCKKTYHLTCVRPALLKKPSRGFAWACAVCSRDQERKLEARRTPLVGDAAGDAEEEEVVEEEEGLPTDGHVEPNLRDEKEHEGKQTSDAEIAHAKMWPMRYLGIHCRVEDVLQYEDRAIYPRASSRLGPKHQAVVNDWYGRPVKLVKAVEIKKKYMKSGTGKKDTKLTKETLQAIEAERLAKSKRPKYIQDEPQGYVARGEDKSSDDQACTARLVFRLPEIGEASSRGEDDGTMLPLEDITDAYMEKAKFVAKDLGVEPYSTDFLDRAVYLLQHNSFDAEAALRQLKKTKVVGEWPKNRWAWTARKDLRDPRLTLSDHEKKKFADGVRRFGSELRLVRHHVRTVAHADVVRYWYYWKKTKQGRKIWGSYENRKNASKKKAATTETSTKLLDDVADDQDDSAFDNGKVTSLNRAMQCKFCNVRHSRFWRRAPQTAPGETVPGDGRSKEKKEYMVALCSRCARLWRHYAVRWEDADESAKKIHQGGGRGWKRRIDEELMKEWAIAETAPMESIEAPEASGSVSSTEPPRKKLKGSDNGSQSTIVEKKKTTPAVPAPLPPPKEPTPPPIPAPARMRTFQCAVCDSFDASLDQLLVCRDCKLTVHKKCYGVSDTKNLLKWSCDPCANDRREFANLPGDSVAYRYECVLCPIKKTEISMVEPPRISHKKKSERERERERLEKELADKLAQEYRTQQIERGRPEVPREALKRTADNKWVHVTCALWTPEVRFSNARALEVAEGIPLVPRTRREAACKLCKTSNGACVSCHHCQANFHVTCAYRANYIFGFDVTPIKSTRRDGVKIVTLGTESGTLSAAIWCKDHSLSSIKTQVHYLTEWNESAGKMALQLFAENYKQADLTLTGTARKASYLDEITKSTGSGHVAAPINRRVSTTASGTRSARNSTVGFRDVDTEERKDVRMASPENVVPVRRCAVCNIDVSPRWWQHEDAQWAGSVQAPTSIRAPTASQANGVNRVNGVHYSGVNSTVSARVCTDGAQHVNGHSPSIATRPHINGIGPRATNGHAGPPVVRSEVEEVRYDCNKCHWRKVNKPEALQKPTSRSGPVQAAHSPPTIPKLEHSPAVVPPLTGPPQIRHANWLRFSNAAARSVPSSASSQPPQQLNGVLYHQALSPVIHAVPTPPTIANNTPSQIHHQPPHISSAPLHIIQAVIPNGVPLPHGPRSLHSHSTPSTVGPSASRQSPVPGDPPPVGHLTNGHAGRDGSPRPSTSIRVSPQPSSLVAEDRPPTLLDIAPRLSPTTQRGGLQTSAPLDIPPVTTTPHRAVGARVSPDVRNILND